jgi:hypothetical protein
MPVKVYFADGTIEDFPSATHAAVRGQWMELTTRNPLTEQEHSVAIRNANDVRVAEIYENGMLRETVSGKGRTDCQDRLRAGIRAEGAVIVTSGDARHLDAALKRARQGVLFDRTLREGCVAFGNTGCDQSYIPCGDSAVIRSHR